VDERRNTGFGAEFHVTMDVDAAFPGCWRRRLGAPNAGRCALVLTAALLSACAAAVPPDVAVRHYQPSEIIVSTSNVGRFRASHGCILFEYDTIRSRRDSALFPLGARLSEDRRSILLPNGQSIRLGAKVAIEFEAPPYGDLDRACGPRPILVRELRA
jgi:hypothetical protein